MCFSITGCRHEWENGSFAPIQSSETTGTQLNMLLTAHAGHTETTAFNKYINLDQIKTSVPSNIGRASCKGQGALLCAYDENRTAYFELDGGFQPGWPVQQTSLGDKLEFIAKNSPPPEPTGVVCPELACNLTFNFRSDVYGHISSAHKNGIFICPLCEKKLNLKAFQKHINPRNSQCCKSRDARSLPLWDLVRERAKPNYIPPGVFAVKCDIAGCEKLFATKSLMWQHKRKTHTKNGNKRKDPPGTTHATSKPDKNELDCDVYEV